jgi:hypothetical protein
MPATGNVSERAGVAQSVQWPWRECRAESATGSLPGSAGSSGTPAPDHAGACSVHILECYAPASANARTSFGDALQEARVVLQAILKPVIFRFKAD